MKPFFSTLTLLLFAFIASAQTYDTSYYNCNKDTTIQTRDTIIHHQTTYNADTTFFTTPWFRFILKIRNSVAKDSVYYTYSSWRDTTLTCRLCGRCMRIDTIPAGQNSITYGIMFLDPTAAAQIASANAMNAPRLTAIRYNVFANSGSYQTQTYKNAGYKVIMTYGWRQPKDPAGFPVGADLVTFGSRLDYYLTQSAPEVLCIVNEPGNQTYYPATNPNNTVDNYLAMLEVAIPVAHAHGVKIANGGLLPNIQYNYIQGLQQQGLTDSANHVMAKLGLRNINGPQAQDAIAYNNKILDYEKTHAIDYTNFHYYQQTPYRAYIADMAKWIRQRTGKPVMCNEFGTWDNTAITLTNFLDELKKGGVVYQAYYAPGNYTPTANAKDNRSVFAGWLNALP